MTEQEAYETGLRALGFAKERDNTDVPDWDWRAWHYPDLRTDPAFAWRVLVALPRHRRTWNAFTRELNRCETPTEIILRLYAAVVALGREHADDPR